MRDGMPEARTVDPEADLKEVIHQAATVGMPHGATVVMRMVPEMEAVPEGRR